MSSVATKVQRTESNVSWPTQSGTYASRSICGRMFQCLSVKYERTEQQYEEFKQKNSWMYTSDGKVGCTPCHEVNNLGVRAYRGINISTQWADGNVTFYGSTSVTDPNWLS